MRGGAAGMSHLDKLSFATKQLVLGGKKKPVVENKSMDKSDHSLNKEEDIVWYWDEPTITLDYEEHQFHTILERNWKQNRIPNIVLSSATLPDKDEISCMSRYFCDKFEGGRVKEIKSYECNKSIPIYDKEGNIIMPHLYYDNAGDLRKCVQHIKKNLIKR